MRTGQRVPNGPFVAPKGEGEDNCFDRYGIQTTVAPFHPQLAGEQRLRKSGPFSKGVLCLTVCLLAVTMYCATSTSTYLHTRAVHTSSMRPAAMVKKVEKRIGPTRQNALSSRGERTQSLFQTQV